MQRPEKGKGYARLVLALAVLGSVGYVSYSAGRIYIANYKLEEYVHSAATLYSVRYGVSPQTVSNDILAKAQSLGLPVTSDNIKVRITNHVIISVDYQVPIDLQVYTWVLHFTPSSENVL